MNRREAIVCIGGAITVIFLTSMTTLGAEEEKIYQPLIPEDLTDEEKKLVPVIDMPKVADDPLLIPIDIKVNHKMTPDDHVQWIEIWDDKAKYKRKARFYFTPANGHAYLRTNIRVLETTTIKVRARFTKDGVWESDKDIKVVSGSKYSC